MNELWAILRGPRVGTTLVFVLLTFTGLGMLVSGYQSVAAVTFPPAQLPFLVSAGLGGLALLGTSCLLLCTHLDRVEAAEERDALAQLQRLALSVDAVADHPRTHDRVDGRAPRLSTGPDLREDT